VTTKDRPHKAQSHIQEILCCAQDDVLSQDGVLGELLKKRPLMSDMSGLEGLVLLDIICNWQEHISQVMFRQNQHNPMALYDRLHHNPI
jgi:hypothetical protein